MASILEKMKVMIVDDEPKIAEVVDTYFKSVGAATLVVYNGYKALNDSLTFKPDLIILDLMLPDISGEDVCKIIRSREDTPIIMLTAKTDENSILKGLNTGADDYVTKPFSPKQLIARAESIMRRANAKAPKNLPEEVYEFGPLTLNNQARTVQFYNHYISLTHSEFEILLCLMKNAGKTVSRESLITFAISQDYEGYERTIDTHIKNLRQKLSDIKDIHNIIETVRGIGYKFNKDF